MKISVVVGLRRFLLSVSNLHQSSIIFVIIVMFTVFIVSLSDHMLIAEGLSALATKINFEMNVGETQVQIWNVINNIDEKGWVEFYATGPGSEFLTFNKVVEFEPRQNKDVEIIASIPKDHPDNIEYKPEFFALKRGDPLAEGITGAQVNIQLKKVISIKIGDNPIYTPPVEEIPTVIPDPVVIQAQEEYREAEETLEEKLARIEAENKALLKEQFVEAGVDNLWETPVDESLKEPVNQEIGYEPEPIMECGPGTEMKDGICKVIVDETEEGGGCLIATSAFGSELAPQVQFLREIRDNTVMSTSSGMTFMTGFNQLYYSFSPTIADMERENPIFQEAVRAFITPMVYLLSIMTLAEEGNDVQVLGFGISVISMNLGLYVVTPVVTMYVISKRLRS